MNRILIRINKKVRVPTKRQIVHQFRSDWKTIAKIDYAESEALFYNIGKGPIKKDSQFAYLIYQKFGPGTYSCLAWRKGKQCMWGFLKLELTTYGWKRLPKNKTYEEREHDQIKTEVKKLNKRVRASSDPKEKVMIGKEIDNLLKDSGINKEILEDEKSNKSGPYPYLKQTHPIYRMHQYESLVDNKVKEVQAQEFW